MSINAKSHNAAIMLNDIFSRLEWYGWHADATADPATVVVQYKSPKHGTWRAVDCDALALARYIKTHTSRFEVGRVCDRKPEHQGTAVQQELNFSELPAIGRAALNPNQTQH